MNAPNRSWRCGSFVILVLAFSISTASAQNTSLAACRARSPTRAPRPCLVTVTVTGPALQVPQITVVSDSDGSYRIENLPVGLYRVAYELTGFQSYIREHLRLTVGFAGRVDVVMKIGALEESITVSGQSPVEYVRRNVSHEIFGRRGAHVKGLPGKVVATLMGHAKVDTMLNVYTQVLDHSVRGAAEKVGSELITIDHKSSLTGHVCRTRA